MIGVHYPASAKSASGNPELYGSPLYHQIISKESLWQAWESARKAKRNRKAVFEFDTNSGYEIDQLHQELVSGNYQPKPPRTFLIHEPKQRVIQAPDIRDSVVQHAIYAAIYPIFDRTFIHDSYGCRVDKGTHKASDKLQEYMRQCSGDSYYLQLDIQKFYYSIDTGILRDRISRKINCPVLIDLIMMFSSDKVGLNIGYLLSQLKGLVYLDRMDHYIKRVLKIKRYVRYVDDFILVGLNRDDAFYLKGHIEEWLKNNLNLSLSKWHISKIKSGVNFVGFRTWQEGRLIRKRSLNNFGKALKKEQLESLQSLLTHAKHTGTKKHFIARLSDEKPLLLERLKL